MNHDAQLLFRIFCAFGLVLTIGAGFVLKKHAPRLFNANPDAPAETSGSLGLSKVQVVAIWLHAFIFFLMGLLLMH